MVDEGKILAAIGDTRNEVAAFRLEAVEREGERLKREGRYEEKLDTVVGNVAKLGDRMDDAEDTIADHTARFRLIKWLTTGVLAVTALFIAGVAAFSNLFKNPWGSS